MSQTYSVQPKPKWPGVKVYPLSRSIRYKEVNNLLYHLSTKGFVPGGSRMHAEELTAFEEWCPQFDFLSDDLTLDFGPNRLEAVAAWLVERRSVATGL